MAFRVLKVVFVVYCFISILFKIEATHQPFVRIRQDIGQGIGYDAGYTTLESAIYSYSPHKKIVPFIDLRSHHFNDSYYALNAGVGLRVASPYKAFGINIYYDYRDVPKAHFTQVGIGLEILNRWWNLRINAYLPVGKESKHSIYSVLATYLDEYFISGDRLYSSFRGVNAEVEFPLLTSKYLFLHVSAGPYFYQNIHNKILGGRAALKATIRRYLTISAGITHDHLFKTRAQAQVAFTLPLGNKKKLLSCMNNIAMQPVQRNEIIVLNRHDGYNWNW